MFASVHEQPRRSKRDMVAAVSGDIENARLAGRNTLEYTRDGTRYLVLHETTILALHANGSFDINTGGWNTITTRARLNEFLPEGWHVYTTQGDIFLRNRRTDSAMLFRNRISVGSRGGIGSDYTEKAAARAKRDVDAYMQVYKREGLPKAEDSGGDPWIMGAAVEASVMRDWVKSRYRFRLIFILAERHAGMSDVGVSMMLSSVDQRGGKLNGHEIQRIRKYVKHCLAH